MDSFECKFKNGQAIGFGILKFSNGDSFQGFFKKGIKNGNVSILPNMNIQSIFFANIKYIG